VSQPARDLSSIASRFKIQNLIGSGGFADVYKAYDVTLDKTVALKVLSIGGSVDLALRFQNEARAVARLSHPNIVSVSDFGQTPAGDLYLTMDYIEGPTLESYVESKGRLSVQEALPIFIQLCDGLSHAHGKKIWHRDVKPSNVILKKPYLEENYQPILVDFGIAKLGTVDQSITAAETRIGSPPYMSPEQARAEDVDQRSDIYSMGCLMQRVLTGELPIEGETAIETIMMQMEVVPRRLNDNDHDLEFPIELELIVARTLEKDPAKRHQNIDELREELTALYDQVSAEEIQVADEQAPGTASGAGDKPARWKLFIPVAVLLAAGIGYMVFFHVNSKHVQLVETKATTDEFILGKDVVHVNPAQPSPAKNEKKVHNPYEKGFERVIAAHRNATSANPGSDGVTPEIELKKSAKESKTAKALWENKRIRVWLQRMEKLWKDPARAELMSKHEVREFLLVPDNWIVWDKNKTKFGGNEDIVALMNDAEFLAVARDLNFQKLMYHKTFRDYVTDPGSWNKELAGQHKTSEFGELLNFER